MESKYKIGDRIALFKGSARAIVIHVLNNGTMQAGIYESSIQGDIGSILYYTTDQNFEKVSKKFKYTTEDDVIRKLKRKSFSEILDIGLPRKPLKDVLPELNWTAEEFFEAWAEFNLETERLKS
jgi:hypothetical protein